MDPQTDAIAREAARLVHAGRVPDISSAIAAARAKVGAGAAPGHGLVRRHLDALHMQEHGMDAPVRAAVKLWEEAESIMTVLDLALPSVELRLAGRGARGHAHVDVTGHVRAYTDAPLRAIIEALVAHGYEEPRIETAKTRWGRLERIRFDDEGRTWVVTRCPPRMLADAHLDLFSKKPIAVIDLDELRRLV